MVRDFKKILTTIFFLLAISSVANAQSTESEKPKEEITKKKEVKTESFGEFVEKVGKSIWNRLNERFNFEDAGKSLVDKKDKILSPLRKKEEVPETSKPEEDTSKKKHASQESELYDP